MAAASKTWSALSTAQSVPAATPTISTSSVQISGGFGVGVCGTITNPGSGLTHATNVNLQVSGDGTNYYTIDTFVAPLTASAVVSFWFNKIPNDAGWVQLQYASNTGAAVTATAIVVYCTGYS